MAVMIGGGAADLRPLPAEERDQVGCTRFTRTRLALAHGGERVAPDAWRERFGVVGERPEVERRAVAREVAGVGLRVRALAARERQARAHASNDSALCTWRSPNRIDSAAEAPARAAWRCARALLDPRAGSRAPGSCRGLRGVRAGRARRPARRRRSRARARTARAPSFLPRRVSSVVTLRAPCAPAPIRMQVFSLVYDQDVHLDVPRAFFRTLRPLFRAARGEAPVLELGCGSGLLTERIAAAGEPCSASTARDRCCAAHARAAPKHDGPRAARGARLLARCACRRCTRSPSRATTC